MKNTESIGGGLGACRAEGAWPNKGDFWCHPEFVENTDEGQKQREYDHPSAPAEPEGTSGSDEPCQCPSKMKNGEQPAGQVSGDIAGKNLECDARDDEGEESPGSHPHSEARPEAQAKNRLREQAVMASSECFQFRKCARCEWSRLDSMIAFRSVLVRSAPDRSRARAFRDRVSRSEDVGPCRHP